MIFCEYASPIPGSALSWSFVAELISIKAEVEAAAAGFAVAALCQAIAGPVVSANIATTVSTAEISFFIPSFLSFIRSRPTRRPAKNNADYPSSGKKKSDKFSITLKPRNILDFEQC